MRRSALMLLLVAAACAREAPPTEPKSPGVPIVPVVPVPTGPLAASLIVSDPGTGPASLISAAAGSTEATTVVYVSLPPGTLPAGASVRIINQRTSAAAIPGMVEGGFDPMAIPAVAGDTIDAEVTQGTGTPSHTRVVAARARPPRVVRTNPPKGQKDVPLNAAIVVVVSEPVDPATVNGNGIRLRLGADVVPGTLVLEPDGTTIRFTPTLPLLPNADYQLEVTKELTDLTAEPLEAGLTVSFTTGISTLDLTGLWDVTSHSVPVNASTQAKVCSDTSSIRFSQYGAYASGVEGGVGVCAYSGSQEPRVFGGLFSGGVVEGRTVRFDLAGWRYTGALVAGSNDAMSGTAWGNSGVMTWQAVRSSPIATLTLIPSAVRMVQGAARRIRLVMRTTSGARTFRPVTWTSENTGIARVSEIPLWDSGFGESASLTALGTGNTTLTVAAEGLNATAAMTVETVSYTTLSGGWYVVCGITTAGQAYCWPPDLEHHYSSPSPTLVEGTPPLVQVSQGFRDACGLTTQGTAYCWEQGRPDLVAPVPGGLTFASISVGGYDACGLIVSGQAYCWNLRDGSASPPSLSVQAPVQVAGGQVFASVTTGWANSCALAIDGKAFCWGGNSTGQLGDGTLADRSTPVPVVGGLTFASITTSGEHTCALTAAGVAYCWGNNRGGQLGTGSGSAVPNPVPTAVSGGLLFTSITTGHDGGVVQWTCGLAVGGAAYCWGYPDFMDDIDDSRIRATPTPISGGIRFRSITAVAYGGCGIGMDGVAYCWTGFGTPVRVMGQP